MQYPIDPVVLIHRIDFTISEQIYLSLLDKISEKKRAKIGRFKFREDALRSLTGELLLKYALRKFYDIYYEKEIFLENEYGKPYMKSGGIHFNISHSGSWTAIACDTLPIGIDIEEIVNTPYEILPRNFTSIEIEQIERVDESVKANRFFELWTLKESYIKMMGKGLSMPLDSFSISIEENKITVKDNNNILVDANFHLYSPDANHILAVCLNKQQNITCPQIITLAELS